MEELITGAVERQGGTPPALPRFDTERGAIDALDRQLEALFGEPVAHRFSLVLFDDTLAPRAPKGTPATFERRPHVFGDAVLSLTEDGDLAVSVHSETAPAQGSVVAVLEAIGGGWPG